MRSSLEAFEFELTMHRRGLKLVVVGAQNFEILPGSLKAVSPAKAHVLGLDDIVALIII
jgi:hypothetical protein